MHRYLRALCFAFIPLCCNLFRRHRGCTSWHRKSEWTAVRLPLGLFRARTVAPDVVLMDARIFLALDRVNQVGIKPVLSQPMSAPNLVERECHQNGPHVDRRGHLEMHIQRGWEQPDGARTSSGGIAIRIMCLRTAPGPARSLATQLRIESGRRRPYTYATYWMGVGRVSAIAGSWG